MIERLVNADKELFLYLNSKHISVLDPLMLILSSYELWCFVFLLFAVLIWLRSREHKLSPVLFYGGAVAFSAAFTNGLKLIVQRPRPIHKSAWQGMIHNIEEYSAAYSFFSSHAATTFCIAVFVFLFFREKRFLGYMAVVWAMGVSYSRIYVSKHYPLDVLTGILFGSLIGYSGYLLLKRFRTRTNGDNVQQ